MYIGSSLLGSYLFLTFCLAFVLFRRLLSLSFRWAGQFFRFYSFFSTSKLLLRRSWYLSIYNGSAFSNFRGWSIFFNISKMLFAKATVVFGLVAISEALSVGHAEGRLHRRGSRPARSISRRQDASQCLEANAIQTGSLDNGQDPPVDGQAESATDGSNFINFCSGQTVTNGLQVQGGSCNGIGQSTSDISESRTNLMQSWVKFHPPQT